MEQKFFVKKAEQKKISIAKIENQKYCEEKKNTNFNVKKIINTEKKNLSFNKSNDLERQNELYNNNDYYYYSKTKKDYILVPSKNEDIIERLKNILNQENQSKEYKTKILNLFKDLIQYLKEKNPNAIKEKKLKDGKINYITKRINISDVFNFIENNDKYNKQKSKNYLLSRLRRFVRILNQEEKLNFRPKIKFNKIEKTDTNKKEKEIIKIITEIRERGTIQILLIFYFLYFLGFNYSTIARMTLKNFKKGFNYLIMEKRKKRQFTIPNIIAKDLYEYFVFKKNNSKYLFYDSFNNINNYSRTTLIKNNIKSILESIKEISTETIQDLLLNFSKTRKANKLPIKFYFLFDYNCHLPKLLGNEVSINHTEEIFEESSFNEYLDKINDVKQKKTSLNFEDIEKLKINLIDNDYEEFISSSEEGLNSFIMENKNNGLYENLFQ